MSIPSNRNTNKNIPVTKNMADQLEPCIGCGSMSDRHPIVAITKDRETGEFVAFSTCELCWRDPKNRKVNIKGHFFLARDKNIALENAGSNDIG